MKTMLFGTWLLVAGGGYYCYTIYQQMGSDNQTAQQSLTAKVSDLTSQNETLKGQVASLTAEMATKKKTIDALRAAALAVATETSGPVGATGLQAGGAAPSTGSALTPTSMPSTITTLTGKTYTGCVLSQAWPDGISFTHSMGVAKVLFSDLDPAYAATFGYNPVLAQKFENDQAAKAAANDTLVAQVTAQQKAAGSQQGTVQNAPSNSSDTSSNAAIQNQIAALQNQITNLQNDAQSQDAAEQSNFEADVHWNNGHLIHNHTLGTSQQAVDDRAQIQKLQVQIAQLRAQLK